jgi:sarcosine oxidase gamma subunit
MAVQGTIETKGGLTATNAYLRISDMTVKKIVEADNANDGKWQLVYGVYCYVNAEARANNPETRLVAPRVDRFKVISDTEPSDPMATAYANLKTQSSVSNVSDLV